MNEPKTSRLIAAIEAREGEPVNWHNAPEEWVNLARELERENAELRNHADYAHRLICDWWKAQTTSQEVHRQYALSVLANVQAQGHPQT